MPIKTLKIQNVRNIKQVKIEPGFDFNIIFGENGSGKTSFLEAIYLLGSGKSFRTHLLSRVVSQGCETFSLFAQLETQVGQIIPIGVERADDKSLRAKVANEAVSNIAELLETLPVLLINQQSHEILELGPSERRQFVDWGLFHVKHEFISLWRKFQRVLKQRNTALKMRASKQQVLSWNTEFVLLSEELNALREEYVDWIKPEISLLFSKLNCEKRVDINYYRGWNAETQLAEVLENTFERDMQLGYTQFGPQRMDLKITVDKVPAEDRLSRGQQKMLVCALKLAQGVILKKKTDKSVCYLIDDLASELDINHKQNISAVLKELNAQVFVTTITLEDVEGLVSQANSKLFHVEHGSITQEESAVSIEAQPL